MFPSNRRVIPRNKRALSMDSNPTDAFLLVGTDGEIYGEETDTKDVVMDTMAAADEGLQQRMVYPADEMKVSYPEIEIPRIPVHTTPSSTDASSDESDVATDSPRTDLIHLIRDMLCCY